MIIELCGLPASGKTTFAKTLCQKSSYTHARVSGVVELVWRSFLYGVLHPIVAASVFVSILQNGGGTGFYAKFMNSFLHRLARRHKAERMNAAIIDEGFFQNIVSVFEQERNREYIEQYIKKMPYPDMLIIFDMPDSVRIQRTQSKKTGDRERMLGEAQYAQWEQSARRNIATLISVLESKQLPCRLVRSSSDEDRLIVEFSKNA